MLTGIVIYKRGIDFNRNLSDSDRSRIMTALHGMDAEWDESFSRQLFIDGEYFGEAVETLDRMGFDVEGEE